jgi:hypothetical protein
MRFFVSSDASFVGFSEKYRARKQAVIWFSEKYRARNQGVVWRRIEYSME